MSSILRGSDNLDSTDWYCSRFIDEGTEIPEDIKLMRAEAREVIRATIEGGK